MKFICDTADIATAAVNVQRAAAAKSVNPVLDGIFMKATDAGLELCGYDTQVGINTIIQANIQEKGSIIVKSKEFCDMLRHLPDHTVSFESDEKNFYIIKSGNAVYEKLPGMNGNDYPEVPYVMGGTPIVLPQKIMKDMIRQVIFAVSIDDSKTVHKGVKFEISENEIKLVALDGYRVAVRKEAIDYKGEALTFIVPAKALSEIIKLIDDEEGFISVNLGKKHIVFGLNGYNIVSGILEGKFLDYTGAVPQEFETVVTVDTQDFIDSIDRMSVLVSEKFKTPLKCIFDEQAIRFISKTAVGTSNDRISVSISGERVEKAFNGRYLSEAFRAIDCDKVLIKMNTLPNQPACIVPLEGDSFFYMVLPVTLPED